MFEKITNTHSCLSFALNLAQIFAIFPVCGITTTWSCLKFRWSSKRTIYSIAFAGWSAMNTAFKIVQIVTIKSEFGYYVSMLFFLATLVTVVIFIDLARKWPGLMRNWSQVDEAMRCYGFPPNLHRKLKIITGVIMVSAAVEHSLYIAFISVQLPKRDTFLEKIEIYLQTRYDHFFNIINYSLFWGILNQVLNMYSTFAWNFMDLFVMLIGLALSSRFSQVAQRIKLLIKAKVSKERRWSYVREDYVRLMVLSSDLDEAMSNVILLSFTNNLFVVLVQLFNSIQPIGNNSAVDKIYFLYSFGFLLLRTAAVALYAARISTESKTPVHLLSNLPYYISNCEIERFLYQAKHCESALSGHKLFKVTNNLLFGVAGAIVAYELVLLQFH